MPGAQDQHQPWRALMKTDNEGVNDPKSDHSDSVLRFTMDKNGVCDAKANGASAPPPPPPPPGSA